MTHNKKFSDVTRFAIYIKCVIVLVVLVMDYCPLLIITMAVSIVNSDFTSEIVALGKSVKTLFVNL